MNKLVYINFISYICSVKGEEPKSLAKEKGKVNLNKYKMKKKRTKKFYRVITPSTFSNSEGFKTYVEAREWKKEWGTSTGDSAEYWQKQQELCTIELVKQEIEEVVENLWV